MVVTGGSSGIGLAAAIAFARRGDEVVLLGRDPERTRRAVDAVREAGGRTPAAYRADFAVLDQVREVGAEVAARHERIHVLANNAGLLGPVRPPTADGFDPTMQINHLAGFLLTHLLLDRMRAAATPEQPARLVTTTSAAESWGTLDVGRPGRRQVSRWLAYGASKQANVLFTVEAARRWTGLGVVATCFFPGLIRSGFGQPQSRLQPRPSSRRACSARASRAPTPWSGSPPTRPGWSRAAISPGAARSPRRPAPRTPTGPAGCGPPASTAVGLTDSPSVPHE